MTVVYKIIRNIILHENCGRKIVSPKMGSSRQEAYTWYTNVPVEILPSFPVGECHPGGEGKMRKSELPHPSYKKTGSHSFTC